MATLANYPLHQGQCVLEKLGALVIPWSQYLYATVVRAWTLFSLTWVLLLCGSLFSLCDWGEGSCLCGSEFSLCGCGERALVCVVLFSFCVIVERVLVCLVLCSLCIIVSLFEWFFIDEFGWVHLCAECVCSQFSTERYQLSSTRFDSVWFWMICFSLQKSTIRWKWLL